MSVIVTVESLANGFTGYARQGTRDHQAAGTSPELAARLAASQLLGCHIADVRAERQQAGVWKATPRHRVFAQEDRS